MQRPASDQVLSDGSEAEESLEFFADGVVLAVEDLDVGLGERLDRRGLFDVDGDAPPHVARMLPTVNIEGRPDRCFPLSERPCVQAPPTGLEPANLRLTEEVSR